MGKQTTVKGYLLDTYTFLWAVNQGDLNRLSDTAKAVIENPHSNIFVSAVTAYQITNKRRRGKLNEYDYTANHINETIDKLGAEKLSVNMEHTKTAGRLDWEHRDPFDRMLAAQARTDDLVLITSDTALQDCPYIETLW